MTHHKAKNIFIITLLLTFFIKTSLAYLVPITGDEAEYTMWGEHLALGYYDHPPMIGWVMHLVTRFGTGNVWLRMPQTIMSTVFAMLMVYMLRPFDKIKAYLIASAYLCSPVSILDQGILTDTVLMWFTFFSLSCIYFTETLKSMRRVPFLDCSPPGADLGARCGSPSAHIRSPGSAKVSKNAPSPPLKRQQTIYALYCLSGVFMGCAYLCKFLLFPAAIAVFLFLVFNKKIEKRFIKLGLIILFALPFFAFNVWWNYYHDWVNYAFNLGLRNQAMHIGVHHLWIYLITILYLYSPLLLWYLWKAIKMSSQAPRTWDPQQGLSKPELDSRLRGNDSIFLITVVATTILFYLALSLFKSIGLHWMFCTYPFAFMAIIASVNVKKSYHLLKFMIIYTGVQVILAMIILQIPMSVFQKHLSPAKYEKVNFFKNYAQLIPTIEPYFKKGFIVMTASYSDSYLLTYKNKQIASVWGVGTDNGRYDDFLSDFKTFNHKNVVVVDTQIRLRDKTFAPYFKHWTKKKIFLNGSPMLLWLGYDFNYPLYRKHILQTIYTKYYTLPKWLPRGAYWYASKYSLNN